jgi:cyanophycin synthetase
MNDASISSKIMMEEAEKRGATCHLFDDKKTVYMQKNGKSWYTRGARTSLQSSIGKTIADKKHLTKKILSYHDLPTAKYVQIDRVEQLDQLNQLQFPIVMKPLDGNAGKGVIVGIKTIEEAREHFVKAGKTMLFEELLTGLEYRIVCVNFKFVAATYRRAAFVTGNGHSSIQELINEKNTHPWRGEGHESFLTKIKVDDLVTSYLAEQGYDLESVPTEGTEVDLRKTVNLSTGGEPWDMTDLVCDENKRLFEHIAKVCDLNVIGIDMMCESLEKPIANQPTAGVIEVNAAPGLRMHHYPLKGQPRNVASVILDMVESAYDL